MDKLFIYIDTDLSLGTPGAEIDDGAALLMLLRNPAVKIAGIGSVFGNVPVEDASRNLARLLKMTGRTDIPLAQGAAGPAAALVGRAAPAAAWSPATHLRRASVVAWWSSATHVGRAS